MKFFRNVSQLFMIMTIGVALYDLVYQGIVEARFKIRTTEEFLKGFSAESYNSARAGLQAVSSPDITAKIMHLHTPVLIAIIAAIFYLIYRILFLINGGDKSQRL